MHNSPYDTPTPYGYGAPNETAAPLSPLDVLHIHEQRRRRALLRVISIGVLVPVLLLIPTALIPTLDKVTLIALILALMGTLAAFLLNQVDQVGAGSFALLAGLAAAVAWEVVAKAQAQHGIDLSDLRLYDLFILPIVVSGVLLGRRGPLIFGAAAALFTVVSLLTLPHTPELQLYWDGHYKDAILGSVYDVIAVPLAIQLLAATGAWLGADSVRNALLEASRADDLAAANGQIQEQTRALELQRYRLQQGIAQLQAVHTAVTRGQWDARATITDGELLPVALSLNLLLDRISRITRESDQRARVDAASHDLAVALRRLRAGEPYTPPNYTGTSFDEVLVELARLRALPAPNAARVTGLSLGGPSLPPRSLPAPASQPERPFPFGPATQAAPRYDPAAFPNPPSNVPGAMPSSSTIGSFLQPGRMSLPPSLNPGQQPNNSVFIGPAIDPMSNGSPIVPPQVGPIASPGDVRPSWPTLPPGPPEAAEDWPDLVISPTPERGPNSTALPAWLQAQATSAAAHSPAPSSSGANNPIANDFSTEGFPTEGFPTNRSAPSNAAEFNDLSASDLIQPTDLPPWLRETAGADAPVDPTPPAEEDDATAGYLPPWLQNIQ